VDTAKHLTADVVTKDAIPVPVDITGTVVVQNTSNRSVTIPQVDGLVRTALEQFFTALTIGEPVRQSDILNVLDDVTGVSYVVTPLTKMVAGDDAQIVREGVPSTSSTTDFLHITQWSTPTVNTYLLLNHLNWATSDAGGSETEARGVFANEERMEHQESRPNVSGVPLKKGAGRAFIIGSEGLYIPGYSDDATLEARFVFDSDPDVKAQQIDAKRQELTQNRILVTLETGASATLPSDYDFTVTYIVSGSTGVANVEPGPAEYLVTGTIDFSYDQDADFQAKVVGRGTS